MDLPRLDHRGGGRVGRRTFVTAVAGILAGPAVVAVSGPVYAARTRPKTYFPPRSIDRTGTVDVTAELTAWLAGLPDGSVADLRRGVYRIDRSLKVQGRSGLRLVDGEFRVMAPSVEFDWVGRSVRRHLWFTHCTDLSLDGISLTGQNSTNDAGVPVDLDGQATYDANREWEHALAVEDCDGVRVTNFRADAVFGDGVYWRRVRDATLHGFEISRNGRQGVAATAASGLQLSNGWIRHSRRSGIDLEPNTPSDTIEDVQIANMTIGSRLIALTAGGPGTVRNVHAHDITVTSRSVPTLWMVAHSGGRRDNWTVERLTAVNVVGSPAPVVKAQDANELVLRDFVVPCAPSRAMTGVEVRRPAAVELTRCSFPGATRLASMIEPTQDYALTVTDSSPTAVDVA